MAVIGNTDTDAERLRQIGDTLRDLESGVVAVLAAVSEDKITLMAACGKAAVAAGVRAGDLIRETARICGGSGGGKPDFAMGGAKDAGKLREALDAVRDFVKQKLE